MNKIKFVKWKWITTKSIEDLVVTCYFECSKELYFKLCSNKDSIMNIELTYEWTTINLDCNLCTDTKWYLQFVEDHWLIKLDIYITNPLLIWYILCSDIILNK